MECSVGSRQQWPRRRRGSEPVEVPPGVEGVAPSFEQLFDHDADWFAIDGPKTAFGDSPGHGVIYVFGNESHDLVRVAENGDVRVVTGEDELAIALRLADPGNDVVMNEAVVQVVFRLVDDQGPVATAVSYTHLTLPTT